MKRIATIVSFLFVLFFIVACDGLQQPSKSNNVTFVTNGGTSIDAVSFETTFSIDKLSQYKTERLGYDFKGWFTDSNLVESSKVTENFTQSVTIYAKWEIIHYVITYHLNEGENHEQNPNTYTVEESFTFESPSRTDHEFKGWFTEAGFVTSITNVNKQTGNLDLYAKWEKVGGNTGGAFDPTELNAIFGFDIYALLPAITTEDTQITNDSVDDQIEVYLDIFDWTETIALAYMELLENALTYDATEDAYKIKDGLYVYLFEDTETYEGQTVYGLGIYSAEETPVIEGVYYQFNIQNTQTELSGSYRDQVDTELTFAGSSDKVVVKASYLADTSAGTPPTGLTAGIIFAANVKNVSNAVAYLEINTLGVLIDQISFDIEARDGFGSKLTGATLEVFDGTSWVAHANGNFYSQISEDQVTITISNVQSSHFRLVFKGTGEQSNGGQFKIGQVTLYAQEEVNYLDSFQDALASVGESLGLSLDTWIPNFVSLTNIQVAKNSAKSFSILAVSESLTLDADIAAFYNDLVNESWTLIDGSYVRIIDENSSLSLAVVKEDNTIEIVFIYTSTNLSQLETLDKMQTINEYEVEAFSKSGLPSTGTYDVLVIPVEISGVSFPTNYQSQLNLVFNGTSTETGWESVSTYYEKSSYGALNLTFNIADKFTTSKNQSYYVGLGDEGDQYAIKEALLGLNSTIDYSQYDSNNDGHIDSVIFIYSVAYDYDNDPWWAWVYSAQYGEAKNVGKLDGKSFEYYMWASYDFMNDSISGYPSLVLDAETYIHELGHLMGIPDFYSTTSQSGPLGDWDMMDYNSGDHGPFNKIVFGWQRPLLATSGNYEVTLESYSLDTDGLNSVILIPFKASDLDDGNAFDEYILIMFYTPVGLYRAHLNSRKGLKQSGIVIYHVDARMNKNNVFWGEYFRNDNNNTSNFLVELLEADKNNSLPGDNGISAGDLLTSGSLDLSTYSWNQGGKMNVSIEILSTFTNASESVKLSLIVQ